MNTLFRKGPLDSLSPPELRVLFMSGYTDDVVASHGILEQGTNFLAKPFTIREIARAVRRALDGD